MTDFFLVNGTTQSGPKGKTWGPSTLHQKERVHLHQHKVFNDKVSPIKGSKSAPSLNKTRLPLSPFRNNLSDIGN